MSKNLFTIINTLEKEEIRNFTMLQNLVGDANVKKSSQLFQLIKNDKIESNEDLLLQFDDLNMNALYRLKNRVVEDIERSLLHLHWNNDSKIEVYNLLNLSRIYFLKAAYDISYEYLKEGLKKSEQIIDNLLLKKIIYEDIVLLARKIKIADIEKVIDQLKKINIEIEKKSSLNYEMSLLVSELLNEQYDESSKFKKEWTQLEKKINQLKIEYTDVNLDFQLFDIVKNILRQSKDYKALTNYLIFNFNSFNEKKQFNKSNHNQKISIVIWILNCLYFLREKSQFVYYYDIFVEELERYDKLFFHNYHFFLSQFSCQKHILNNDLENCLTEIQQLKKDTQLMSISNYRDLVIENEATILFYLNKPKEALKAFSSLFYKEIYRLLSPSMHFQLLVAEIVITAELNEFYNLDHLLKELKRRFRSQLEEDSNEIILDLVHLLKEIIKSIHPSFNGPETRLMIQKIIDKKEKSNSSKQIIHIYPWLKSKLNNTSIYEEFLSDNKLR